MWDLPGPGLEPMSPALAGRFLTTVLPGKSHQPFLPFIFLIIAILTGVKWCLVVVLIWFPWWSEILSIFSYTCPKQLWAGFLMESSKCLVDPGPMMSSEPWLQYSQCLPTSQSHRSPWYSGRGEKVVGFLSVSHKAEKAMLSPCPLWEITGQWGAVSLGIELCCLGEGVTEVKWNCPSYPLKCIYSWMFCSNGVLEILHWIPGRPQR